MYNKATPKLQNEPKIEFLYTYVLTFLHAYDLQNKPKILRFQPKNKSCSKNKAIYSLASDLWTHGLFSTTLQNKKQSQFQRKPSVSLGNKNNKTNPNRKSSIPEGL